MSLPTIDLGSSPGDIENKLRNNSTIYETDDEGDVVGHSAYNQETRKFYYDDYGQCGSWYRQADGHVKCRTYFREPKRYEFDTFLELAAFLAFFGREWT